MQTAPSPSHTSVAQPSRAQPHSPSTRATVLIGPAANDPTESVSCVNRAFVDGLQENYRFVSLDATRTVGNTRQCALNGINAVYFALQLLRWFAHLITCRPQLAHYAISSGWAMEKGLLFMKIARLCGAKTLGHLHSGAFIEHWRRLPAWRKNLALRQLKALDGLVLASEWWRAAVAENIGLPLHKLHVVSNPIDPQFEVEALQMPLPRAGNVAISLGVMGRDKGIFDLLAALDLMRDCPEFQLRLAGPDREPGINGQVRQYILDHKLGESVSLQSRVSYEEKIGLFQSASIFILPSYYENFPLVLIEAAAAGHAIVTTPVGAIPEFFEDGISALFIEPGKPKQIAQALIRLLQNPEERLRMGRAARSTFSARLARPIIMKSLDRVYQCLLQSILADDLKRGHVIAKE